MFALDQYLTNFLTCKYHHASKHLLCKDFKASELDGENEPLRRLFSENLERFHTGKHVNTECSIIHSFYDGGEKRIYLGLNPNQERARYIGTRLLGTTRV